ncbi:MAG: hypothetical protein LBF76_02830, partial [Holosporales bacterium]|nr:hypothetical protein [Holosporales bacterium]
LSLFSCAPETDIATLAAPIPLGDARIQQPQVAKIALSLVPEGTYGRALYFSRAPLPYGGPYFHHMGIYAFRKEALARFVALPPSLLEQRESLEQLRALEAGMIVSVKVVNTVPLEVNTSEDLEHVRKAFIQTASSH